MITITNKDWMRMFDLIADGDDGERVAKSIKQADKALARYVAAMRLISRDPRLDYDVDCKRFWGHYSAFGNKALELGVTTDTIYELWDSIPEPTSLIQEVKAVLEMTSKRVRIPSNFFKEIRKASIPLKTSGPKRQMGIIASEKVSSNGRKWNVPLLLEFYVDTPYHCSIDVDVITDEGDGSNLYAIVDHSGFEATMPFGAIGYQEFRKCVFNALQGKPGASKLKI